MSESVNGKSLLETIKICDHYLTRIDLAEADACPTKTPTESERAIEIAIGRSLETGGIVR